MFFVPTTRRNLKTHQSPVSLDLCLRETRVRKSYDYDDVIVSNSSGLKSVFEKLRFRDRLVWSICTLHTLYCDFLTLNSAYESIR